jgi:hypothetical protein
MHHIIDYKFFMKLSSVHITQLKTFKVERRLVTTTIELQLSLYNNVSSENDTDFSIFNRRKDKDFRHLLLVQHLSIGCI